MPAADTAPTTLTPTPPSASAVRGERSAEALPRMVLHVLNSATGGAANSTVDLIHALRTRHGIEACAVCSTGGTPADFERLRDAVDGRLLVRPLFWWNRKNRSKRWKRPLIALLQAKRTGFTRRSVADVVAFAREHAADLLHSNTFTTIEGGHAARRLGVPHVWHLREITGPGGLFLFPYRGDRLRRFVRKMASVVVPNSIATATAAASWLPTERALTVFNGLELARFSPRLPLPAATDPVVVGMVANLDSQSKEHGVLLAAAARARVIAPDLAIEYRFYGGGITPDGPATGEALRPYVADLLARRAGLDLPTDVVRFMGRGANPVAMMAALDVLVHPARQESFGRIAVEAMAAALPVVGPRAGGIGEIVLDPRDSPTSGAAPATGRLVEPGDVDGFAAAIVELARDPALRATLGAAGRKRAQAKYSLEACADGVASAYCVALTRPLG